jgi:hypothetical protein
MKQGKCQCGHVEADHLEDKAGEFCIYCSCSCFIPDWCGKMGVREEAGVKIIQPVQRLVQRRGKLMIKQETVRCQR